LDAGKTCILSIPRLPLLAEIDHLQEVGTGPRDRFIVDRPEIGDRDLLNGRFGEKQEPNRCVGGLGKLLQLFEGRLGLFDLPKVELGEPGHQLIEAEPRPLARPAEQFRFDIHSHHVCTLAVAPIYVKALFAEATSRISIFPVTAAVIRAARYSCSLSIAAFTFSIIRSIFAVSESR